jgi:gliding motility-associated-like protein
MRNCLLVLVFILFSITAYSQCTLSVNLSATSTSICSGNKVTLTANTSGGTGPYTYTWSTGQTTQSIDVNKQDTYKVIVTDKTPGCQPVTKSIDIVTAPTPEAPTTNGAQLVCTNSSATLHATAPGGFYQWFDAPSGGNFLGSGDTFVTPPITSGITFYVQTTINGCTSLRTSVFVNATGNPFVTGMTVCSGNSATLKASGGDTYEWYASSTGGSVLGTGPTFTTPILTATTVFFVVATINGCVSAFTPVTATVTPAPQQPVSQNQSICAGSIVTLHVTAPGPGIYSWFDVPSGGIPLILSPDYTTPSLTQAKTYYVQNSINGCESARTAVTVTINPIPPVPGDQVVTTCKGTSILLTASATPSGTYQWYDSPAGGKLLNTGVTYQTPVLNSTATYYVLATNGGCSSGLSAVKVVINPPPAAPSVAGAIICNGSSTILTATGPGGTYDWYSAATGGVSLHTAPSFTTPALTATTQYYVQTTLSGCISARKAVTVAVNPVVSPPNANNTSTCSGSPASLAATGPSGTYEWYSSLTGGTLLSSGQAYTTPPLTSTTIYYVQITTASGCTSARKAVTVTVNPVPAQPTISGTTTICSGSTASLTASAATGTIQWYDAASGGNLLKSGATFTTPALTVNTTYYVQNTTGQCVSSRTAVTITLNSPVTPQFKYSSGSICISAPNPIPVINNPLGGTFSASPAGMTINPATGEIDLSTSTAGNYIITFKGNGTCVLPSSIQYRIFTTANALFTFNAVYCQDEVNPKPAFPSGAGAGTFSATPAGLVFVNTSTGEIDLKKSTPNTYTIQNDIPALGGCGASTATSTITIDQSVIMDAGPNQIVPAGTPVQLNGGVSSNATAQWSGGTGTFSNTNIPNPVYTPGAGETSAVLTYTSNDPPGSCGPKSDKVTITFKNTPASPTVAGNLTCLGSSANLSAIAPGGTYKWYDAATGGTLLFTGANYTTPALLANTTYYVETVNSIGIASPRTTVLVTVNTVPPAPVVPTPPVCAGNTTTLTPTDLTGSFEWYDAATGGNLLSKNSTYTTTVLTANQSYYVQKTVNGCVSPMTKVDVSVSAVPSVISSSTDAICSGNALNYAIKANMPTATFLWSRAQVPGISNPAVNNQSTSTITETLINTSGTALNVTYVITPINNNCSGTPFNYVVTVNSTPTVISRPTATVCNGTSANYEIKFNTAADFEWSRAAVAGIGNTPVSGQNTGIIRETLFNNTNAPIDVTYIITSKSSTCTGIPFKLTVTVNPLAHITSPAAGVACSNVPQNYVITSNIPSATYIWSRPAVPGITNPTVSNQTSSTITETLINNTTFSINVYYSITPIANGCPGKSLTLAVFVHPQPAKPVANSNSPICVGSTIKLRTPDVANATYTWTGPNGFTSALQNPDITNVTRANLGAYSLYVTIDGCPSLVSTANVVVRQPPTSFAGPDQAVCIAAPNVQLKGSIGGGTGTGIWTSDGSGLFSPSLNYPQAQTYVPSEQDKAAGKVVLTLTSTSDDDCKIAISSTTIKFGPLPVVMAGPDQNVCSQTNAVNLSGKILIASNGQWSTTGTGTFSPSANQLNAVYVPSAADVTAGSVNLILLATNAGPCDISKDTMKVSFVPPPTVNAGGTRYVLKNRTITLKPTVSDENVQYLWTPNVDINDNTAKNPVITGDVDRTYTLQVTDIRGCVSKDTAQIKVSPEIVVPNTFTPNADGINDLWNIQGLIAYSDATVDVFTRYGQKVFHSIGYDKPWDGIFNGKRLPVGVYYYVIDTKLYNQVLSGSLTLIR